MSTDKVDSVHENVENVPYKPGPPKSAEERQAALAAALEKDPGVSKWSLRALRVCSAYMLDFISDR
jgi:hypothetical protein